MENIDQQENCNENDPNFNLVDLLISNDICAPTDHKAEIKDLLTNHEISNFEVQIQEISKQFTELLNCPAGDIVAEEKRLILRNPVPTNRPNLFKMSSPNLHEPCSSLFSKSQSANNPFEAYRNVDLLCNKEGSGESASNQKLDPYLEVAPSKCSTSPSIDESINNSSSASTSRNELKICTFCKKNGEPAIIYEGHELKNSHREVTCPILSKYTCELCGATGKKSHTRKYCPLYKKGKKFYSKNLG